MLQLTRLRELTLHLPTAAHRPAWLSAASGLVCVDSQLYVVADDELQLGIFSLLNSAPGQLLRLLPGELPQELKQRKKRKPDFEVLLRLPSFAHCRHGALLALGSGSKPLRCRGALIALDEHGGVQGEVQAIDTADWFQSMAKHVAELNLEGAWVSGTNLYVLQRGNKAAVNAVLRYELQDLLMALPTHAVPALKLHSLQEMPLGFIDSVPLCFSDGCALPDGGWLFTAVAEDTDNAYADGQFKGAAIGRVNAEQQLQWIKPVTPAYKIEGIDVIERTGKLQMLMVTDADEVNVPAVLLSAELPE